MKRFITPNSLIKKAKKREHLNKAPNNYENNELIRINYTKESIQNNEINEPNLIDFNKTLI
jgi:hypothetical protein